MKGSGLEFILFTKELSILRALLINPKFPRSFWTSEEQLKFMGAKAVTPPLGLITVAAMLPKGWDIRLVDLETQPSSDIDLEWPDIVMISGMLIQRENVLEIIREAKSKKKKVVVGGPYATSVPDEVLEAGCDMLVRGEAENTVDALLDSIRKGNFSGVFENPVKPDLSTSPIPRFDLLNINDYNTLSVQTSRGCPFDCEFCDIVNLYGAKPRYKNPQQVIDELETIYRLGWRKNMLIADDNFIGSRKHAKALLKKLNPWMKNHGSPFSFWTQASVNLGQDVELIDLMTEPNFSSVFVGIESPDEDVLAGAHKYQNIKNPLMDSLKSINQNGLTILGSFVIGFDGEKPGTGKRISNFVKECNIPIVMLNMLQAAPNTKLWDRLQAEGRLCDSRTTGNSTSNIMNFTPSRSEADIVEEFVSAWDEIYDHSNFLTRAYNYYLTMRPTRRASAIKSGATRSQVPKHWRPLNQELMDIKNFFRISWRQGVKSPARRQYWRQIFGMWTRNPSRFVQYIVALAMAEDMFVLRKSILEEYRKSKRPSLTC